MHEEHTASGAHRSRAVAFPDWVPQPVLDQADQLSEVEAIWFCDPHSPWQRGQIENQNRTWRWWFPRGTDLAGLDPAHVDHVAHIINNQRRRHLGYHSPASLYAAATTVH
jgi:IS30 family transposase